MNVKTEKAVSATRIDGIWVIQSTYGRDARPADASESRALEIAWNGDTNGSGDPWVALPLATPAIRIQDVNSSAIFAQGKIDGIDQVILIGTNGKNGDARISAYWYGWTRVITTNGDPIWEEQDPEVFAAMIQEIEA